jgi:hypothetical protein
MSISRNRGRIGGDARTVKVLRPVFERLPGAGMGRFTSGSSDLSHHIKGAFAADISVPRFRRHALRFDHAGSTGF